MGVLSFLRCTCDGGATKYLEKAVEAQHQDFETSRGLTGVPPSIIWGFMRLWIRRSICSPCRMRNPKFRTTGSEDRRLGTIYFQAVKNSRKRFNAMVIRCVPVSQCCKGSSSGVMSMHFRTTSNQIHQTIKLDCLPKASFLG